jgi:hypothetical protein
MRWSLLVFVDIVNSKTIYVVSASRLAKIKGDLVANKCTWDRKIVCAQCKSMPNPTSIAVDNLPLDPRGIVDKIKTW